MVNVYGSVAASRNLPTQGSRRKNKLTSAGLLYGVLDHCRTHRHKWRSGRMCRSFSLSCSDPSQQQGSA